MPTIPPQGTQRATIQLCNSETVQGALALDRLFHFTEGALHAQQRAVVGRARIAQTLLVAGRGKQALGSRPVLGTATPTALIIFNDGHVFPAQVQCSTCQRIRTALAPQGGTLTSWRKAWPLTVGAVTQELTVDSVRGTSHPTRRPCSTAVRATASCASAIARPSESWDHLVDGGSVQR